MDGVALVQIVLPDGQVGQRYGKVVYAAVVEQVFLTMLDELVEASACFVFLAQCAPSQSLIENLVRLRVVVEKRLLRFGRALGGLVQPKFGVFFISQSAVSQSFVIPDVVLFGIDEFALAQVVRVLVCGLQQSQSVGVAVFAQGDFGQFHMADGVLPRDFSFTAFPRMEFAGGNQCLGLFIAS